MKKNNDNKPSEQDDAPDAIFPVVPNYHPIHVIPRRIYNFLASAKLAMFLLVTILICCLTGTTVYRDEIAWKVIFSTLWFNALLVLLVVNVACCFFGRIWGRRLTIISFGMILFHLSFVTLFVGVVYNSMNYFRATIRLTEGETLPNADLQSYDSVDHGRFFDMSRIKGETSLIKMHRGFKVDGKDKRAAYEIAVGEGTSKLRDIIYFTKNLTYRGYTYFPDREGYSALTIMYDKQAKEIYGAHLPLQSLRQPDKSYIYATGSKEGPGILPFPQKPEPSLCNLNVAYLPETSSERVGEVQFQLWPLDKKDLIQANDKPLATGKVPVGSKVRVGEYYFSVPEIRYWVAMNVRYEPGQPIILTSLWVGLFGVTLTTLGRMFRKKSPGKNHE